METKLKPQDAGARNTVTARPRFPCVRCGRFLFPRTQSCICLKHFKGRKDPTIHRFCSVKVNIATNDEVPLAPTLDCPRWCVSRSTDVQADLCTTLNRLSPDAVQGATSTAPEEFVQSLI